MNSVYLSLGSNLGDREASLLRALEYLNTSGVRVVRQSSIYETEPQDFRDQPWFLNMVVEIETALSPAELLGRIHEIEGEMGRKRIVAKGPRTIDIDILFYGNVVIETPELTIPHPRLDERRFVLEPLAELAPDLIHPLTARIVRAMLSTADDQGVKRWRTG